MANSSSKGQAPPRCPTDITYLFLGGTALGTASCTVRWMISPCFANALSPDDIVRLSTGTAPDALGGANQLVAYWDFDDALVFGPVVGTPLGFKINANDVGSNVMDQSTIALSLDDTAITPTSVVKSGSVTTIEYLLANPPFESGSTHTVSLTMNDTGGTPYSTTSSFAVASFGLLASDMALPPASVNRVPQRLQVPHLSGRGVNAGNGVQAAEDTLAGKFGPNVAYLEDLTGVDARGYFSFTDVINLDTWSH